MFQIRGPLPPFECKVPDILSFAGSHPFHFLLGQKHLKVKMEVVNEGPGQGPPSADVSLIGARESLSNILLQTLGEHLH